MVISALIGPSGTGKSYRASSLAAENNIDCIIDDGLLIQGNRVLEGFSAKKEPTKIKAVRRALFMELEHAQSVTHAIESYKPETILILGTSENMVKRIAKNLMLPDVGQYFYITELATSREIAIARRIRREEGKHVIPVPTFEIQKDFSGYFIHPLKTLIKSRYKGIQLSEKTVVRPTFSYMGRFYISDSAIESIVLYNCTKIKDIKKVFHTGIQSHKDGITILAEIGTLYERNLLPIAKELQVFIKEDVEMLTGMNVLQTHIVIKTLYLS